MNYLRIEKDFKTFTLLPFSFVPMIALIFNFFFI